MMLGRPIVGKAVLVQGGRDATEILMEFHWIILEPVIIPCASSTEHHKVTLILPGLPPTSH